MLWACLTPIMIPTHHPRPPAPTQAAGPELPLLLLAAACAALGPRRLFPRGAAPALRCLGGGSAASGPQDLYSSFSLLSLAVWLHCGPRKPPAGTSGAASSAEAAERRESAVVLAARARVEAAMAAADEGGRRDIAASCNRLVRGALCFFSLAWVVCYLWSWLAFSF